MYVDLEVGSVRATLASLSGDTQGLLLPYERAMHLPPPITGHIPLEMASIYIVAADIGDLALFCLCWIPVECLD